jgi:hypothetical protein
MWGTSLPEDKLAGDLGNVIEATSIRRSSVRFFFSRQIGAGQFETFSTASTLCRHKREYFAAMHSALIVQ